MLKMTSTTGVTHGFQHDDLRNQLKPVCGCKNLRWVTRNGRRQLSWAMTYKEITCQNCLNIIRNMHASRYTFKWTKLNHSVEALVTVSTWPKNALIGLTEPTRVQQFTLHAGSGVVGMKGTGGGTIPFMSEERSRWLHAVAQAYYAASFDQTESYIWLGVD